MSQEEYDDIYVVLQKYRQLKFLESADLKRLFPDGNKLKEIESWMSRNQPDWDPLSEFFNK